MLECDRHNKRKSTALNVALVATHLDIGADLHSISLLFRVATARVRAFPEKKYWCELGEPSRLNLATIVFDAEPHEPVVISRAITPMDAVNRQAAAMLFLVFMAIAASASVRR